MDAVVGIAPATFVVASILVILLPGPDMAIIARNTIAGGRTAGIRTASGTLLGISVHVLAAVAGLSAILVASAVGFTVVKLVGAAYLAFLGVRVLLGSLRGRGEEREEASPFAGGVSGVTAAASSPVLQGTLSSALNPKLAVFFLTFLPQFVDPDRMPEASLLAHGAVFVALASVWLWVWVRALDRFAAVLRRPRVRAWVERAVGAALVGLGVRVALERR